MYITNKDEKLRWEIGEFLRDYFICYPDSPDYGKWDALPQGEVNQFLDNLVELVALRLEEKIRKATLQFL